MIDPALVSSPGPSVTFCVLMVPARGCFCRCSLGAGSLFSAQGSSRAGTPSLSVLPVDDGAPNWMLSIPSSALASAPDFTPYDQNNDGTFFIKDSEERLQREPSGDLLC